jgi:hypothetical protein
MSRWMRLAVTLLAGVGLMVIVAPTAGAREIRVPMAVGAENQPVYGAVVRLPGRHVDSVLTDLRGALTGTKGTGWLLHVGTQRRDTCEGADTATGLRMVCLAW